MRHLYAIECSQQARAELGMIPHHPPEHLFGTIVLDLGANYGQMSILWSQQKPNVKVYAFEASTYVFKILKKMFLLILAMLSQ